MSLSLSERAVMCKRWRWMPGMLDVAGFRLAHVALWDGAWQAQSHIESKTYYYPSLPELTDPATLGCLLALVRESWKSPAFYCFTDVHNGWVAALEQSEWITSGESEAEALVKALEAAP